MNPAWLGKQIYVVFTEKTEPVEDRLSRDLILEMDETDGWFYTKEISLMSDKKCTVTIDPFFEKCLVNYENDTEDLWYDLLEHFSIEILNHPLSSEKFKFNLGFMMNT